MKEVLIISFSHLRQDARVSREVEFFKKNYKLTIACYDGTESPDYELIRLPKPALTLSLRLLLAFLLLSKFYKAAYWKLYNYHWLKEKWKSRKFDWIIANDVESLPLAFALNADHVWFDAHEYAPRHFEEKLYWRLFFQDFNKYLCKTFISKCKVMTTVSQGLANEYEKEFGRRPQVLTNATRYHEIKPHPVDKDKIRIIHHGAATPSRQLELSIEMMDYLDERFHLDFMLIAPSLANKSTREYLPKLKQLASRHSRIRFVEPVASDQIVPFITQYDIGLFLLPPINFNYANTLPNKFFDFLQARLAIAVGPTPEMASLVEKYQLGIASQTFNPKDLAAQLNGWSASMIESAKQKAAIAARELNAEKNFELMQTLIETSKNNFPHA